MFCKEGVLRNFEKLTGKHLCLKKTLAHCFPVNFEKFLRTFFLTDYLCFPTVSALMTVEIAADNFSALLRLRLTQKALQLPF